MPLRNILRTTPANMLSPIPEPFAPQNFLFNSVVPSTTIKQLFQQPRSTSYTTPFTNPHSSVHGHHSSHLNFPHPLHCACCCLFLTVSCSLRLLICKYLGRSPLDHTNSFSKGFWQSASMRNMNSNINIRGACLSYLTSLP
jgi:hypothetical protein